MFTGSKKKRVTVLLYLLCAIGVLIFVGVISSYLTKQSLTEELQKKPEDYVGTFAYGSPSADNELVYIAVGHEEKQMHYVMYSASESEIISEGQCRCEESYIELYDDSKERFYIVPMLNGYTLFSHNRGVHSLEKISEGPVMPTSSND